MSEIYVPSEELLRRLIALEKAFRGVPVNDVPQRRRHVTPQRSTQIKIAVLDGDLAHGGSATASVYTASAGTETDSGVNVTVYDFDHIGSGKEIVSGTKIYIANINGYWYVINTAVCATTA
jgi:hypothetical protein